MSKRKFFRNLFGRFFDFFDFLFSAVGVKIGNVFGDKYKSKAELVGGIILILLGVKLLLDGLGVFGA